MNLFYCENISNDTFILEKEESTHLIKVLRKKKGDHVLFTDGKGILFTCEILENNLKHTKLRVLNKKVQPKHDYYLHIAISPTKNIDRIEWFIEKSTELNIDEITPIICGNSERKSINIAKLSKIMISASKQSLSTHFPIINETINFTDFINSTTNFKGTKLIAHCNESLNKKGLKFYLKPSEPYIIAIGPEGDFRNNEITLAQKENFHEISLGNKRLRTETAGLICVNYVNFINEK